MNYREFCQVVEWDYMYYLYKCDKENSNDINFPFCCHLSANLISSYFSVHFDSDFKHKEYRNPVNMHGWSENRNEVIDFTGFQKELSEVDRNQLQSEEILSLKDFVTLIQKCRVNYPMIQPRGEYESIGFGEINDIELYGIEFAKNIFNPYTLEGFLTYIKESLPFILENVEYRIL